MAGAAFCMVLLLAASVAARCRYFPAIGAFQMDAYLGPWYLQYKYSNAAPLPLSQCWSWYYYKDVNDRLQLQTTYVNSLTNHISSHQSRLWMKDPTQSSMLRYETNRLLYSDTEDYQVIATDYSNFTVEYQCTGTSELDKRETVWLLTREQYPHPFALEQAFSAVIQLGMEDLDLHREYQGCQVQDNTDRSGGPTFLQWLTAGASGRADQQLEDKSLSGFLAWLGL